MQAIARLLYNATDIVILDDPFTALDGSTESQIIDNLLGPDGWLRRSRSAVFFITNSGRQLPPRATIRGGWKG